MLSLIKVFIATLTLIVASAYSQNAYITLPEANSTISAGSNTTVQITQPDSNSSWDNIAIVLGLQSCPSGNCLPATETMGTVMYQGPYNPVVYGAPSYQPYENFTVQIPSTFPTGEAQLAFSLFVLIGASLYPGLQISSEIVFID